MQADGSIKPVPAPTQTRVVSNATAAQVESMLEAVTTDQGTAPDARIPGYRVAGKTGTAQRVDPTCGCYRGYTASFVGFAPADNPQLVVLVVLDNPIQRPLRRRGRGAGIQGRHVVCAGVGEDSADRHDPAGRQALPSVTGRVRPVPGPDDPVRGQDRGFALPRPEVVAPRDLGDLAGRLGIAPAGVRRARVDHRRNPRLVGGSAR